MSHDNSDAGTRVSRLLATSVHLLGDLNPTPAGSNPGYFVPFGDQVVFNAETNDHQQGFWISDGNLKHTQLLGELNGYAGTFIGNVMYFEGVVDDPSPELPRRRSGGPTGRRRGRIRSQTYQYLVFTISATAGWCSTGR